MAETKKTRTPKARKIEEIITLATKDLTDKEKERLEELQVHLWNAYELINDILDEYSEGDRCYILHLS